MKKWMDGFQNVENRYLPKVRYWFPHAVVCAKGLERDMADLAERGFGGVEAVSMKTGITPDFYHRDNLWGSEKWIACMKVLLHEAKKHGFSVDISNGPAWPIANIDAKEADDETTLYELSYGLKILQPGESYNGNAPLPAEIHPEGTMHLKTVGLYRIVGDKCLDFDSYQPLAEPISVTVSEGQWALFAFWERPAKERNAGIFYVADHFSRKATDAVMDVWEKRILPALGEDRDILHAVFCDSLEYVTDMDWSRGFAESFEERNGYSILPYLPVLGNAYMFPGMDSCNQGVFPDSNVCGYSFSNSDIQHRVNMDYYEMLTYFYCKNHLEQMQTRAEAMGLTVRSQLSYNKNLEAECAPLYVGIPENEALGRPQLDNFRIMAAGVNLGRKPVYSFECNAEMLNAYGQTHEDILWWIKRSYAGGMNAQVFHGAHYCGYYDEEGNENGLCPGINWPGYESFTDPVWSNGWNRTLSAEHQKEILTFLGRCNYVLRNPHKVDAAVYRNDYTNYSPFTSGDGTYIYKDGNALNDAGFSYEFLSPQLMQHKNAVITDGIFDKDGAAYKAIIVDNEEYMDYEGALKLLEYGKAGLPILFVGRYPEKNIFISTEKTDEELRQLIRQIPHTFVETHAQVPDALKALNVLPDVLPAETVPLRPVHVTIGGKHFYYVYNGNTIVRNDMTTRFPHIDKQSVMKEFTISLSLLGEGDVYELDGFFGSCIRHAGTVKDGRTQVSLHFDRDEAKLLAVLTPEDAQDFGIQATPAKNDCIRSEILLNDWTLQIRKILPPQDRVGTFYESCWEDMEPIKLSCLKPWKDICEDWKHLSGIGIYTAKVNLDAIPARAEISFEKVSDTYSLNINGCRISSGDPAKRRTDITKALKTGENTIEVTVCTQIQNAAIRDFIDDFISQENNRELCESHWMGRYKEYGIWGKAALQLY